MSRGRRGKYARRQLTDQEILEWFLQKFSTPRYPLIEEIKGFLKAALLGIFVGGPFLSLVPFPAWFNLIPAWYLSIPIGANAVLIAIWAASFYLAFKNLERSISNQQEHLVHFIGIGAFGHLSWLACYGSLMLLLGSIGCLVRIQGFPWWLSFCIYGISGIGLWSGRKILLRAIVEGPEAHPWFWPIRLLFATSLGLCIFLTAVSRILMNWLEQLNAYLSLLILAALYIGGSILFLSLAMIGGIIGYLHYQRWRGAKELKV